MGFPSSRTCTLASLGFHVYALRADFDNVRHAPAKDVCPQMAVVHPISEEPSLKSSIFFLFSVYKIDRKILACGCLNSSSLVPSLELAHTVFIWFYLPDSERHGRDILVRLLRSVQCPASGT